MNFEEQEVVNYYLSGQYQQDMINEYRQDNNVRYREMQQINNNFIFDVFISYLVPLNNNTRNIIHDNFDRDEFKFVVMHNGTIAM